MKCPTIVCCTGLKGKVFLDKVVDSLDIQGIYSYPQQGEDIKEFEAIKIFAQNHGIKFEENKRPNLSETTNDQLVFLVGWQWLIREEIKNLVVFHDSLLPRYRGFTPTVTALINGEKEIGISAIKPVKAVDAGPIYGQFSWKVEYPIKLNVALEKQAEGMGKLAIELGEKKVNGDLSLTPQNEEDATYAIWRTPEDGEVNWNQSSEYICRFIDSVGSPYTGALSYYDGKQIIIDDASVYPEMKFEIRQVGKIFQLADSKPLIICGKGMIRINQARYRDSMEPVVFKKIKLTMGQ